MNKTDVAERLADRTGMSKALSRDAVDGVFAAIGKALTDGEEVRIAGFGTFGTRNRPARAGRNRRIGEAVSIPASTAPTFKAGKTLKDAVNSQARDR
ncbi:MAG: HU family DNA-binding protein [Bryobacterales bacterium]|nr:HU family DNA-binding protein [Bryobacterales bacterium]